MKKPAVYVLDSDVFIAAKNTYYAFEICPGFWESIVQAHEHDRVRSIDRIKAELLAGQPKEDLVVWVNTFTMLRSLAVKFDLRAKGAT